MLFRSARTNPGIVSPPARVAWIETSPARQHQPHQDVATREGGVDRNVSKYFKKGKEIMSPPARVAWIETETNAQSVQNFTVATREGGVDRNQKK